MLYLLLYIYTQYSILCIFGCVSIWWFSVWSRRGSPPCLWCSRGSLVGQAETHRGMGTKLSLDLLWWRIRIVTYSITISPVCFQLLFCLKRDGWGCRACFVCLSFPESQNGNTAIDDNHSHREDHHLVMKYQHQNQQSSSSSSSPSSQTITFNIDNNIRLPPSCYQELSTHVWRLWTACAPKVAEHSSWNSSAVMGSGRPNNRRQGERQGQDSLFGTYMQWF